MRSWYWAGREDSGGKYEHVDTADGHIPISGLVTSASLHDSQAVIPLAAMTRSV